MDYRTRLRTLADRYSAATGLSLARIATLVHNQGAFFVKLERGAGCTVDTYEKFVAWFAERWPEGAEWPPEVLRPAPRPVAGAAA
jgi:hypothetical protein